jgi:cation transport ATPase
MKIVLSLLLIIFLSLTLAVKAQILSAKVGVNGLTCSMCTRSVEMSLRRLDFVDSVVMSLQNTEGEIFFNKNHPVDFESLAKAVVDAGFSVRFLKIRLDLNVIRLEESGAFAFQGQDFVWLDYDRNPGKKVAWFSLIGDTYLPKSEMKKWKNKIQNSANGTKRNVIHVNFEG